MTDYISYLSSNIDWCEDNFHYNSYIVELWNSLSSLFILFTGLFGMFLYPKSKILFSSLIPIGITSAYFHGSLSLLGQLSDELSILFTIIYVSHYINDNIFKLCNRYLLLIINFCQLYCAVVFPDYNRFILFIYSFIALKIINKINDSSNIKAQNYIFFSKIFFYLSVLSWIIDYFLCIKIINFHSLWHILISFTAFYLFKYLHFIGVSVNNNTV
jgi:alkaline ceramidase